MSRIFNDDRGISALWVAVVALFLVAAAALAVDTSGAFNTAQTDQTTADLSCLAGVPELPDTTAAIDLTVEYAVDNWPKMDDSSLSTSISGTTGTYSDGNGNEIYVDAAYGGDPEKMHVRIREVGEAYFSKAIGQDSIRTTQEAWCRLQITTSGGGSLPFGATVGGFDGDLQIINPCPSGNCGPIDIDHDDVNGSGPQFEENLASGSDRLLTPHHGPQSNGAVNCNSPSVGAGDECHIIDTNTGVSAGQLGDGMESRLEGYVGAGETFVSKGVTMNGDTPAGVLSGDNSGSLQSLMDAFGPDPIDDAPDWWDPELYGPYDSSNTANHYYYNAPLAFCDHPRLGFIPIITEDLDWEPGSGPAANFTGNTTVKVVGTYWVVIVDPNGASDFFGNNNLNNASSIVVWFGDDADTCGPSNQAFDPSIPGTTSSDVFLVNDAN